MKKKILLGIAALFLAIATIHAQGLIGTINNAANKVNNSANNVSNTQNNASNAGKNASGVIGKVGGFFKKKNANNSQQNNASGSNQTNINVKGISLSNLKKLNENVKNCSMVTNTVMKFNSSVSTIIVTHSGSTNDMLDAIEKKSKDIFTEKNIIGLEDGSIALDVSK